MGGGGRVAAMSKISHMDLKLYKCYHYQICGKPLLLPANLTPYWLVGPVWYIWCILPSLVFLLLLCILLLLRLHLVLILLYNLAPFNKALLLALAFRWAGAKMVKKAKKYLSDERTSEPKG